MRRNETIQNPEGMATNPNASNQKTRKKFHIEFQGWRKQCLFVLFFFLILLMSINLILTLWILKVMEFSHVRF